GDGCAVDPVRERLSNAHVVEADVGLLEVEGKDVLRRLLELDHGKLVVRLQIRDVLRRGVPERVDVARLELLSPGSGLYQYDPPDPVEVRLPLVLEERH